MSSDKPNRWRAGISSPRTPRLARLYDTWSQTEACLARRSQDAYGSVIFRSGAVERPASGTARWRGRGGAHAHPSTAGQLAFEQRGRGPQRLGTGHHFGELDLKAFARKALGVGAQRLGVRRSAALER